MSPSSVPSLNRVSQTDEPPLSVAIAVRDPWPKARPTLDAIHADAATVGAEVIVAASRRDALPDDPGARYRGLRWFVARDKSVFGLRALALEEARAEVCALTEDHAVVRPGWCARHLEAHRRHPEAAAVGGAVENGATASLADWASFFVASGPFLLPLADGPSPRISLQANVSYKRRFVAAGIGELGWMALTHHEELQRRGELLLADPALVVDHVQSLGWLDHSRGHFHNGRSIAAFRARRMTLPWRWLRAGACAALPSLMLARTVRDVRRKGRLGATLLASLPMVSWFLLCHATGEALGYLAGPGDSLRGVD